MDIAKIRTLIEKQSDLIVKTERDLWAIPEVGYREFKTDAYMKAAFRKLGYELTEAEGITGFFTVVDTGKPGPTVLALAELDALYCADHPDRDKETNAVHACGHHAQCAALLGLAAALKEPGALEGLSGRIKLCLVPAEEGIEIDNFEQALQRAHDNGVTTLVVQPTHLMHGLEYTDVKNTLDQYADQFETVVLAEPLLSSDEDFEAVAQAITEATKDSDNGTTALVFMGHGTEADSNAVYAQMQGVLTADGFANYYVGTVEATPSLDDVVKAIEGKGYTDVVLTPLMVVAGDHANNDMAAPDDPESWYSTFTAAGYNVTANLTGLGSLKPIQDLYVQHTQAAIDSIQ